MKILKTDQVQLLDKQTIDNQYISSFKLMERAASKVVEILKDRHKLYHNSFVIICGKGNNGGDGLAIARLLKEAGAFVKVYLHQNKKYTPDNSQNQEMLDDRGIKIEKFLPSKHNIVIKKDDIIIDALFGMGLTEAIDSEWKQVFDLLNTAVCQDRISIDMPSGMFADIATANDSIVFKADMVYTFGSPKLALLLPESAQWAKDFTVVDINLDEQTLSSFETKNYYLDKAIVKELLHTPTKFAHKGIFGHSLIIGGSYGKIGAVALASKAALSIGSGLVTAYLPKCGYSILQSTISEVMCLTDNEADYIRLFPETDSYQAIGIGVGLGQNADTVKGFAAFLKDNTNKAMVFDADAINILASDNSLLKFLAPGSILTPHPKELERLLGGWTSDFEKMELVKGFTAKHNVVVVVKGAHSEIVLPSGDIYFNSTGNWGMATAGTGDVLTGILTGLLAQGYNSEHTALIGVYLHGLAGDFVLEDKHPHCILASDIINKLSSAYKEILNLE
ncbi:NAD(P)H-hydrate dehydratase [Myroides sp. BIT-d1]|uniref:Bifunctional NAD(P)H-hydrate repair enzyme n=1 Tax=Myroides albus TaxID=2562892 RepID=A0A6I3LSK2_9FLAO|nr:NAD(P)H-hydrate dehydratase [Myroides albus]MTG99072.1 NAD(P)H-hydrate dehydratase [Myroides albus]